MRVFNFSVKKVYVLMAIILMTGCNTVPQVIDTRQTRSETTMGLDYRDFENAAAEMVTSMISSGAVNHPGGGRYILAISSISNDTLQRIDTDQLIKKIRVELLNSGKVVVTTAVGLNGPEDQMSMAARELRGNSEFDQSRVARRGTLQAPDLSLSGKIIQRNNRVGSNKTQADYYFQLSLTDINSGLALWEGESYIGKLGGKKSVAW